MTILPSTDTRTARAPQAESVPPQIRAAWFGDGCPPDLADAAAARYVAAVGARMGSSPGSTGRRLMDELRPRGMAPRESVTDWPAVAVKGNAVTDLSWLREPAATTPGAYIHAYDKNGQYLAACSSLELGMGGLTHETAPTFDKRVPGYWRFDDTWYLTPEAAYLRESDALDQPSEAYTWTRHGRALVKWYECLRDARTVLMADESEAGALAYITLKQTYRVAIGWLTGYWFNPDDDRYRPETDGYASPAYRPDWRHTIISQARATMRRTLDKIAVADADVVAVHIDQIYIVSDEPDARAACPAGLTLGDGLGQWKVRYSGVPLDVCRTLLRAGGRPLALDDACEEWEEGAHNANG